MSASPLSTSSSTPLPHPRKRRTRGGRNNALLAIQRHYRQFNGIPVTPTSDDSSKKEIPKKLSAEDEARLAQQMVDLQAEERVARCTCYAQASSAWEDLSQIIMDEMDELDDLPLQSATQAPKPLPPALITSTAPLPSPLVASAASPSPPHMTSATPLSPARMTSEEMAPLKSIISTPGTSSTTTESASSRSAGPLTVHNPYSSSWDHPVQLLSRTQASSPHLPRRLQFRPRAAWTVRLILRLEGQIPSPPNRHR